MRKMDLLEDFEAVAVADRRRGGRPFADAVHGQHGGVVVGRGVERRRRVAQMMFAEQQPADVEIFGKLADLVAQQGLLKQLFLQPQRDRHLEGAEAARRHRDVGLQQPLEFEERLVVEHHVVEAVGGDAGFFQAIGDGVVREGGIMLAPGKAFLLGGGDDAAVLDQRRGAVVVECGNPENAHRVG